MSLHLATDALQHITDAMNIDAASPPPVYVLTHPLGLAHNLVPFVRGMLPPQDPPLQVAATTVATTLTHTQQQLHVESSGSGSGGGRGSSGGGGRAGGGGGGGGGSPSGGQPTIAPTQARGNNNNGHGLVGKELTLFNGSRSKSKTFL